MQQQNSITKKDGLAVTVLMPALNEEKNVAAAVSEVLKAFDRFDISGELILFNDGSTDSTQEIAQAIMKDDPRVKIIKHDTPRGMGACFWEGVDEAAGESIVMLPGDNENYPSEILRYHKLLDDVDIVIPFTFNKEEARSPSRNRISNLYRRIINATFGTNFNYTNGTILYRIGVLRGLSRRNKSFFFQTDILIRISRQGYLFAEVPYRLGVRREGRSKAVTFSALSKVVKGYCNLVRDIYFSGGKEASTGFPEGALTGIRRNNPQL